MKLKDVAIVATEADTGNAYARLLNDWESNMVLAQLQALDGGALKMVEVEPFILRGVGLTEARARRIVEKQNSLHLAAREGVTAFEDMASNNRRVSGTGKIPAGIQQIPKPQPKRNKKRGEEHGKD